MYQKYNLKSYEQLKIRWDIVDMIFLATAQNIMINLKSINWIYLILKTVKKRKKKVQKKNILMLQPSMPLLSFKNKILKEKLLIK
jgi:hypothetical protein